MTPQEEVLQDIQLERAKQIREWGSNPRLPDTAWLAILTERIKKAAQVVLEAGPQDRRIDEEVLQVATVAVAWLACRRSKG